MAGGRSEGTPSTVTGRAMIILGAFSDERPVMGLQELSRQWFRPLFRGCSSAVTLSEVGLVGGPL